MFLSDRNTGFENIDYQSWTQRNSVIRVPHFSAIQIATVLAVAVRFVVGSCKREPS